MAVEECIKRSLADDSDDDDDAPIVFKRTAPASKQSQSSSALRKAATNGEASNSRKPAAGRPADASASGQSREKRGELDDDRNLLAVSARREPTQVAAQKADARRAPAPASKQLPGNGSGKGDPDLDDEKPLSAKFAAGRKSASGSSQAPKVKEEARSAGSGSTVAHKTKEEAEDNSDSDHSEDEKPLSSRFQSKPAAVAPVKSMVDSDDEKPLVSRFKTEAQQSDSDDEKPLVSRFKQNGSSKKELSSELKTPKSLNKRPLGDGNGAAGTSEKKAKVMGTSASTKVKQESAAKKEVVSEEDDDDYMPISQRIKKSASPDKKSAVKKVEVKKVIKKKIIQKMNKSVKNSKFSKSSAMPPGSGGGQKWTTLEHSGVIFPPPYKPHGIKMLYNGHLVDLTPEQEEVATMFAVMKDTDYATKPKFIENFMNDWRQILGKNHVIKKIELCDFTPIYEWHLKEKEKKKQMTTEEKKAVKEEKMKLEEKYMWAIVDGVKEKVGNFRVEPPGLFRGRGEHPKMGKLKRRIRPRDITINIGKGAPVPECPIPGERWKEIRHDNTVTWLAFWNDPINPREFKYVFLAASSSLKGQSDKEKYEKARLLKDYIRNIRVNYTRDFASKDPTKRQIAVATYLIDKLALRAGNEKDSGIRSKLEVPPGSANRLPGSSEFPTEGGSYAWFATCKQPGGRRANGEILVSFPQKHAVHIVENADTSYSAFHRLSEEVRFIYTYDLRICQTEESKKLAAGGNDTVDDDEADTVGCCTLKVENVMLVPENKLQFDFLGKDSIRYFNTVEVEPAVYKAIGDFRTAKKHNGEKKKGGDDLFDMLDTSKLNAHLKELMPGLTAKVFRTYNASITLDEMLSKETREGILPEKIAIYQSANKEVAIICNHQRSVSKSHDSQMSRLNEKIDELKAQREEFEEDLGRAKKGKPPLKDSEGKTKRNLAPEALEKKLAQIDTKIEKMEIDKKIKEDLKTVALGTSKINYLDPRITVAWCKRNEVPIEKIFNKSLLAKFSWAMDVDPDFRF